tara:strand:- start:70 stop:423 length:354 start_codon:yes stop_codon:yes gene_type:complete
MEKNIIILLFLTFFCSCISNYSIKKPDNLINQEKMEAILYDLSIINSIKPSSYKNPEFPSSSLDSYIFIKYGVDSLQLTQSESYYSKIPKIYLKIYNNVEKRLKKTKDSLNKINLSN